MKFTFNYEGVLHIHTSDIHQAREEWANVCEFQTPCIIWLTGRLGPWAAFPMERLLEGVA
ncbi:MAG: hypothetical protein AAF959_05185 [Cyanobacteria bacterium P01_D01_bin.56]